MTGQALVSEAAKILASTRKQASGTCDSCGASYTGLAKRRYCSVRCLNRESQRMHRARLKGTVYSPAFLANNHSLKANK